MEHIHKWVKASLAVVLAAIFLVPAALSGQTSNAEEVKRKVRVSVAPKYPDLAKRLKVGGKVKIIVSIAPDGHVKSTRVIGGHPLLVQPSVEAVKEWKFAAGPEETTQLVEIVFNNDGD